MAQFYCKYTHMHCTSAYEEDRVFLTFIAFATHVLRSTTHRLWSRSYKRGRCSHMHQACTERPFCCHRSGLYSKHSSVDFKVWQAVSRKLQRL